MPKPRSSKLISDVKSNRPLPHRVSSYSPSHKAGSNPPEKQPEKPTKTKHPIRRAIVALFLLVFCLVLVVGVWDAKNIASASQKLFGSSSMLDLLNSTSLKGSDRGRVNVLLMGYSIDDPGHPAATLTDSIIVLSMSQQSKTGYILSIPRDLYINIPDHGYGKINEVYGDGGVEALKKVIEDKFQIPIDYYVLVNYAAVRDSVNALNGVTVDIKSQDSRGLYDTNISPIDGGPLKLANGPQKLDGQTALNLTRARGDSYNSYGFAQADFDRTQHQRQVLTAIKDKLNWKLVLDPRKNSKILNAGANNLKTDLAATEARPLFGLFNSIPSAQLKSLSLRALDGQNYLASYTTVYGQSALIPTSGIDDYSTIVKALSAYNQ